MPTGRTAARYIDIAQALPRDSDVARAIGCLLVLRADLLLEHYGLVDDEGMTKLDLIDMWYRKLFFFRANSRTIYSGRWVLNRIAGLDEYKSWLDAAEAEIRQEWNDNKKLVDRAFDRATTIRNAIGAHAEATLMDAVGRIPDDQMGWMEFSTEDGERPRIASSIVFAALLPNVQPGNEAQQFDELVRTISGASGGLLNCMRIAFNLYAKRYPLWGRDYLSA